MIRRALALSLGLVCGCNESSTRPPTFNASSIDIGAPTDRGFPSDDGSARIDTGTRDAPVSDASLDVPVSDAAPADVAPADVAPADAAPADAAPADVPVDAAGCAAPPPLGALTGPLWCDLVLPAVPGVTVPDGFCIRRFGYVPTARVLVFAPNGDLFVASPAAYTPGGAPAGMAAVAVLFDDDRDGAADTTDADHNGVPDLPHAFISDVDEVHGLLFRRDTLLYTVQNAVMSVPYCSGDRTSAIPHERHTRVSGLPVAPTGPTIPQWRWTHTLAESTDGRLLVSVGQHDASECPAPDARAGSVLRIGAGAPDLGSTVVDGFRNPMYIRCKEWGACYAAELTHDGWSSYGGHEKLIEIRQGDHYGFPCCVDRGIPVPGVPRAGTCMDVAASVQTYPLHDTPFGFDWAPSSWPAPYSGSFFVGLHGWVTFWTNAGVQWAPVDPTTHRPTRATEVFVRGFGRRIDGGNDQRVSDLVFARDGRMFFADDQSGEIYWVAPRTLRMPAR